MFDLQAYFSATVAGIPLLFVVLGLVQWCKTYITDSKAIRATSMAIGWALGGSYMIATNGPPADFAGWFGIVVFGLGLGLVASGIYDVGKDLLRSNQ
jgi:hypothetical protein